MAALKETNGEAITLAPIKWRVAEFVIGGVDGTSLAMQNRPISVINNLSRKDNGLPTIKYPSSDARRFIDSIHWISDNKPDTLDDNKTDEELMEEFNHLVQSGEAKFGIPIEAFKESIVKGAYRNEIFKSMVVARGALFIFGEYAEIEYQDVKMEKVPTINKNAKGAMVISVYSKFTNWKTRIKIKYNSNIMSATELANIINAAGASVGILARRPELSFGKYGAYEVLEVHDSGTK